MNIAVVYFSYGGDELLLRQALRAIPHLRAYGDTVEVFLADDAAAPLSEVPEGVHYLPTSFNRCGNLNGAECICGMAQIYAHILKCGRFDWVIKTDCDTYINNLHWLRNLKPSDCLFAGTAHCNDYPAGPCYAISAAGIGKVNDLLSDSVWRGKAQRGYCEDRVFFHLARRCGAVHVITPHLSEPTSGALYHDWGVGPVSEPPCHLANLLLPYAVDFKTCRWNSPPSTWQQHAATALSRLTAYANLKDSLFLPSIYTT